MNSKEILLQEYSLNKDLKLKNRIVMAPMTRAKAGKEGVPTEAMVRYYERRAHAGLIITEGVIIRPDGKGHDGVPGVFTNTQLAGWKQVTDRVHARGGKIFAQIWHVGRVSHPTFIGGELPISPSPTNMKGRVWRHEGLFFGESREASLADIQELIRDFAKAATAAREAGFDGVEIHGANGYLIDQFLHYSTNLRTDEYGGSPEKMARFALEVVRACGEAIGYERVGLRLSPMAYLNEIAPDECDRDVFAYLLKVLNDYPIAYLHTGNFDDSKIYKELDNKTMTAFLRQDYHGTLIGCGSYTPEQGARAIAAKEFDLLALGRPFIANPNLIEKLTRGLPLQAYDANMLQDLV